MTKEQILELRNQGKTYAEIGEMFGVSKQWVHQMVGEHRIRKGNYEIEHIRYKGIYEFMRDNPTITLSTLTLKGIGKGKNLYCKFQRAITGTNRDMHLSINQIKRLTAYTGKSFEELFAERNDADEEPQ